MTAVQGAVTNIAFDEPLALRLVAKFTSQPIAAYSVLREELDLMPLHLVLICSEYEEATRSIVPVEQLHGIERVTDLFAVLAQARLRDTPAEVIAWNDAATHTD
jgi:hypothetical protein